MGKPNIPRRRAAVVRGTAGAVTEPVSEPAERSRPFVNPGVNDYVLDFAEKYWHARDGWKWARAFRGFGWHLAAVLVNVDILKAAGMYEAALLAMLTDGQTNLPMIAGLLRYHTSSKWMPTSVHGLERLQRNLLRLADPAGLRAAGQPLPGPGPFTLYRGVCGRGAARRVRGLCWTGSEAVAWWFARTWAKQGRLVPGRRLEFAPLEDPGVYRAVVPACDVLAHVVAKGEDEYLVTLRPGTKVTRLREVMPEAVMEAEVRRLREAVAAPNQTASALSQ